MEEHQGTYAKVLVHSIYEDKEIVSFELKYHAFIHAECKTHRMLRSNDELEHFISLEQALMDDPMLSRNGSSFRAIPVNKMLGETQSDPALPVFWGKNQKGMSAVEELEEPQICYVKELWNDAIEDIIHKVEDMNDYGLHKQTANRLLMPFQWMKVIVTGTEWKNFFYQRTHKDAQPEMRKLANLMQEALDKSKPQRLEIGEWHLPYILPEDFEFVRSAGFGENVKLYKILREISSGRCARVSYDNHNGKRDHIEDLELFNKLMKRPYVDKTGNVFTVNDPTHPSPTEHQATPIDKRANGLYDWEKGITHLDRSLQLWSNNFKGWIQHRALLESN